MALGGAGHDRIIVQENPVNWLDPQGLLRIPIKGKIYEYRATNEHHGVNPPEPHVHDVETGQKVGTETGNIYDPKGKTICGKIGKKALATLRGALRKAGHLIGLAITAYETYDLATSSEEELFQRLVQFSNGLPSKQRDEFLEDLVKNNPDKFHQVN